MSDNELSKAIIQKFLFKPRKTLDYARAVVKAGLNELLVYDCDYFGPDDLPEDAHPADGTTSGCVFASLRDAHIIRHSELHKPAVGIIHGRRRSKHRSRKSAWINLWTLTNMVVADAFLNATEPRGEERPRVQGDMFVGSGVSPDSGNGQASGGTPNATTPAEVAA